MGRIVYCTREAVQDAFDVREAAHRSTQIDDALRSASDDIDAWLNRHKHGVAPTIATRYFNWPVQDGQAWRLWLDENELVSVATLTAGGTTIAASDYFLEPVNSGPPYTNIEIDLSSSASFTNSGTAQRAIRIVGTWGVGDQQDPAGLLDEALDASETGVNVTNASLVGVGDVLLVDSERMVVTDRSSITTAVNLGTALTAQKSNQTIAGISGGFNVGEVLLIGSERMKIVENNGTDLTVIRAYDGSTLAAHSIGATLFAYRTLTVERGALGTTAATHLTAAAITKWRVPDLIRDLCKAEAITRLEQEFSAYGARVYSDEAERDSSGTDVVSGRGLTDIRKSCARRYKRKFRKKAI